MQKNFIYLIILFTINVITSAQPPIEYTLQVHESGRFLIKDNGEPFFWLGDTGWRTFSNLNREEVVQYFTDRVKKRFNVIQCQILPINLNSENAYGFKAMENQNPDKLIEGYWQHADFIIQTANDMGLYLAIVPALGKKLIESKKGIFYDNAPAAYRYGKFLGTRYKHKKNIIWIMGGDTWGTRDTIWYNLAKGIADGAVHGDFNKVLMSFHPKGGTYRPPASSSGEFYHNKEWMDFNMIQSGHKIGNRNYERISEDYQRTPVKPTLESEPCYEHHPVMHKFSLGCFDAWHMRRRAYWAILAGSLGYTYGANGIWQMSKPEIKGGKHNYYWYEALDFEGAFDMTHVRDLFESRPFIEPERVPDQSIYAQTDLHSVDQRVQCARAADYSYWILYITNGKKVVLDFNAFKEVDTVAAWWFNPRDGKCYDNNYQITAKPFATLRTGRFKDFYPPGKEEPENDWVLVLDDVKANYNIPGKQ